MLESSIPFNEKFLSLGEAWEATARRGRGKEKEERQLWLHSFSLLQQRIPLEFPARADPAGTWAGTQCSPPQTPSGTLWGPTS